MKRLAPLCLAVAVSVVSPAEAETIWQKALHGQRTAARELRQSVEQVLMGRGEERDLLAVRVGLITLSRGEIEDELTLVMLLRLRREMGLAPAAQGARQLAMALSGRLSLTERAWAQIERAHFSLSRGDLASARVELDGAVNVAWRASLRAEALLLRGLTALRAHDAESALADFQQVYSMDAPRRQLVQAHIGEAMAQGLRGDLLRATKSSRRAFVVDSNRATVSRTDPFWDWGLSVGESRAVRALMLWGQADTLAASAPANAQATRLQACGLTHELAPDEETTVADDQDRRRSASWGTPTLKALKALWAQDCSLPIPADPVVPEPVAPAGVALEPVAPESSPTEADASAPGNDENDL